MVAYRRLKTKEFFKLLALKVVADAYERWSLTRGPKDSDLTRKRLVFWKTGHRGEVVAYERWSQLDVRLYKRLSRELATYFFSVRNWLRKVNFFKYYLMSP